MTFISAGTTTSITIYLLNTQHVLFDKRDSDAHFNSATGAIIAIKSIRTYVNSIKGVIRHWHSDLLMKNVL